METLLEEEFCFTHEPLETKWTTRILELLPADNFGAALIGDLVHVHRRSAGNPDTVVPQDYIALSYAWGTGIFDHDLTCDGKPLAITANVDCMLRHLRERNSTRRFWIDAICLNQSDKVEKSQQVPLMAQIYGEAKEVLVWLGPAAGTLENQALDLCDMSDEELRRRDARPEIELVGGRRRAPDTWSLSEMAALVALAEKPWFSRRWTIQEVSVATERTYVQCGLRRMPWEQLADIYGLIGVRQRGEWDESVDKVRRRSGVCEAMYRKDNTMLRCLFYMDITECSVEHDRLAAFQNIVPKTATFGWTVNYEQSFVQNFADFTRGAILNGRAGDLRSHLKCFGNLSQRNPDWPAWVPDWSRGEKKYTFDPVNLPSASEIDWFDWVDSNDLDLDHVRFHHLAVDGEFRQNDDAWFTSDLRFVKTILEISVPEVYSLEMAERLLEEVLNHLCLNAPRTEAILRLQIESLSIVLDAFISASETWQRGSKHKGSAMTTENGTKALRVWLIHCAQLCTCTRPADKPLHKVGCECPGKASTDNQRASVDLLLCGIINGIWLPTIKSLWSEYKLALVEGPGESGLILRFIPKR